MIECNKIRVIILIIFIIHSGVNPQTQQTKTKEELDQELEQYMSNTKASLDNEINEYMQRAAY